MSNPLSPSNHPNFDRKEYIYDPDEITEQIAAGQTALYDSPVANSQRAPAITHFTFDECSSAALPPTTLDQPAIQEFATGAKRGTDHSDCYLHLIPPEALYAYGRAFAEGAKKYGLHNWLKGFPFSGLVNHALHHLMKILEGDVSEDHVGHLLWNIGSLAHFMKHRPDLNDLPPYKQANLEFVRINDSTTAREILGDYVNVGKSVFTKEASSPQISKQDIDNFLENHQVGS